MVRYLAGAVGRPVRPCRNGLPALAGAVARLADAGRVGAGAGAASWPAWSPAAGACAHPDGTVRLVGSLLTAYGDEVTAHATGGCAVPTGRAEAPDEHRCGWTGRPAGPAGCASRCCPSGSTLDEWGYPVVTGEVAAELLAAAREAVRTCPTLALRLVD